MGERSGFRLEDLPGLFRVLVVKLGHVFGPSTRRRVASASSKVVLPLCLAACSTKYASCSISCAISGNLRCGGNMKCFSGRHGPAVLKKRGMLPIYSDSPSLDDWSSASLFSRKSRSAGLPARLRAFW